MNIQGDYNLELRFADARTFINFWNTENGEDILCQIRDGKLYKFVHSVQDVEADQLKDISEIEDVFEQKEITLTEFVNMVKISISSSMAENN